MFNAIPPPVHDGTRKSCGECEGYLRELKQRNPEFAYLGTVQQILGGHAEDTRNVIMERVSDGDLAPELQIPDLLSASKPHVPWSSPAASLQITMSWAGTSTRRSLVKARVS